MLKSSYHNIHLINVSIKIKGKMHLIIQSTQSCAQVLCQIMYQSALVLGKSIRICYNPGVNVSSTELLNGRLKI